ncbi:hypothetical protein RRF57_002732 [Xylaria bambusicola]|uniref:Uncharacterized protein n=1 Tax=Xylaria bambusicola TaxID=326684 RepID=A0AAN7Z228_9PEZI
MRETLPPTADNTRPYCIYTCTMKLPGILLLSFAAQVLGQAQTCTQEMIASDDCAAVIDANACYNEFRWNAQTLQCIDGKDNTDRQRKIAANIENPAGVSVLQLCRYSDVQLGQVAEVFMRNKLSSELEAVDQDHSEAQILI